MVGTSSTSRSTVLDTFRDGLPQSNFAFLLGRFSLNDNHLFMNASWLWNGRRFDIWGSLADASWLLIDYSGNYLWYNGQEGALLSPLAQRHQKSILHSTWQH